MQSGICSTRRGGGIYTIPPKVIGERVNYTQIEIDDETQFSRNKNHTEQCKIILRMMINISQPFIVCVCVSVCVSQLLGSQRHCHQHRCIRVLLLWECNFWLKWFICIDFITMRTVTCVRLLCDFAIFHCGSTVCSPFAPHIICGLITFSFRRRHDYGSCRPSMALIRTLVCFFFPSIPTLDVYFPFRTTHTTFKHLHYLFHSLFFLLILFCHSYSTVFFFFFLLRLWAASTFLLLYMYVMYTTSLTTNKLQAIKFIFSTHKYVHKKRCFNLMKPTYRKELARRREIKSEMV